MAKSKSILKLQGTIIGLTFVESRTYEPHVRKARSTSKVNSVFEDDNLQITNANRPARLIKKVIDEYRHDFKGGMLWQRLVSYFKKQVKSQMPFDVTALKGMEVNEHYPLSRLISLERITSAYSEGTFRLAIHYSKHPDFKRKYIDSYQFMGVAIFPDFEQDTAEYEVRQSEVISFSSVPEAIQFSFPVGAGVDQFLVCLKMEGWEGGLICSGNSVKGMQIISAGKIPFK